MEVRDEPEPVRPRVGREHPVAQVRERGDAAAAAQSAGEHDVGLHHVHAPAEHEVARLVQAAHHLSGRKPQRRRGAQARVAVEVGGGERLLEPVHAQRLERPRALDRVGHVPRAAAVARHAPAVVGVHHQLHLAADGVAHGLDDGDVVAPVGMVEADLDGADARVAQCQHPAGTLGRLDQLTARGVGEQPLRAPAQQPPQRFPERSRGEVPDGHLDDPGAPAVEVDGLAQLAHDLGAAGIEPDQQPLEQRRVGQLVAAGVPRRAVAGAHDDERRLAARPRHRVPRRAERRVEREPVAPDLDRRDLHVRRRRSRCSRRPLAAPPARERRPPSAGRARPRSPRAWPRGWPA